MKLSTVCAALAVVIATLPPPAWATDITYALSSAFLENPSAVTLSGTITTDGVIGDVQSSDIVSYDITAVFDSNTIEETNSNSSLSMTGGLTATANSLAFDFSHATMDYNSSYHVYAVNYIDDGSVCFADGYGYCGEASALDVTNTNGYPYGYPAASDTIAPLTSSAPEPAAWTMMLIGAAGVGGVLRRRRAALLAA